MLPNIYRMVNRRPRLFAIPIWLAAILVTLDTLSVPRGLIPATLTR